MDPDITVKLSLCLSKYHTIKMHPLPNQAPCCEEVQGSGLTSA